MQVFTHEGGNMGEERRRRGDSTLYFQAQSGGSFLVGSALLHLPRLSRLGARAEVRLLRDARFAQRQQPPPPLLLRCVFVCACVLCCLFPAAAAAAAVAPPFFCCRQGLGCWAATSQRFSLSASGAFSFSPPLENVHLQISVNSSSRVSLLGEILKETAALKSSSWIPTGRRGGVAGVGMA